jgi:glycosyltransferase involved in cell wall biosynthesis
VTTDGRGLRVLLLTYSPSGGAGIAAMRLHTALRHIGVDCQLSLFRGDDQPIPACDILAGTFALFLNKAKNRVAKCILRLGHRRGSSGSLSLFPSGLARKINRMDFDVVHLHWPRGEMISIEELGAINKRVVWTFHDLWPLLGTAGVFRDDLPRAAQGYNAGNLPPGEKQRFGVDLERWVWERKRRAWRKWKPSVVCPSRWMSECVRGSPLFDECDVCVIKNPVDLHQFYPVPMHEARRRLGLTESGNLVLFGAYDLDAHHKGGDLLAAALHEVRLESNTFGVCFGGGGKNVSGMKIFHQGTVGRAETMALLYSAADLFICPSRIDNLPNTCVEAIACGTPVVAFNTCGLPDIVDHQQNGYLAAPFEVTDLARGIEWVLSRKKDGGVNGLSGYDTLCQNARQKAERLFAPATIAHQYVEVYKRALGRNEGRL